MQGLIINCGSSTSHVWYVLLGGAITLVGSICATWFAHYFQLQRDRNNNKAKIRGVLLAIKEEITNLYQIYSQDTGAWLEKYTGDEPCFWIFPIASDYFVVFDNNAGLLGEVANDDLRAKIISTYLAAKFLVDSFKYNNTQIEKLTALEREVERGKPQCDRKGAKRLRENLTVYGKKIKKSDEGLRKKVTKLIGLIDQAIRFGNY